MQNTSNGNRPASLIDYIKAWPQYALPQHMLSNFMHMLTRSKRKQFKNLFINWFINQYQVDMSLSETENFRDFDSFNSFFTRSLKPTARPVTPNPQAIACPVDGSVSQLGNIENDVIFQAKGRQYSLQSLLAYQSEWSNRFINGSFATLYLSPRDYHRIHMPVDGKLMQMSFVPGKLFSVNPATTRAIPALFARNERVICFFETELGAVAVIFVGAIFVGSMETVWHGTVTPPHGKQIRHWFYENQLQEAQRKFAKGDEIGRFNMGSTVVLLFEADKVDWNSTVTAGGSVTMGCELGFCR